MKTTWINNGQKNIIVYFAGWGSSPETVAHLVVPPEYDALICYDFRDLKLDFDFSIYRQIRLVAWSMGVWVATQVMQNLPLISAVAINGTLRPCDDEFGIPKAIFQGTLDNLNESNLVKFQRRICGDRQLSEQYRQMTVSRQLLEIHQELTALYQAMQQPDLAAVQWTGAIICQQDRIFPAENQQRFWQGYFAARPGAIRLLDLPHYPFHQFNDWLQLC